MSIKGKCLCGAVRYEVAKDEVEVGVCHCGMCRAWTGGMNISFEAKAGEAQFEGTESIRTYRSSDWAERAFCATCGSSIFYRVTEGDHAGDLHIAAGTLESWDHTRFAGEIFIDAKPAAYALAGDHPRMTEAEFMASIGVAG